MEESKEFEYSQEQIAKVMREEYAGAHISLIEQGIGENGKPIMGVSIESNIPANVLKDILRGLLKNYEESSV